MMLSFIQNTVVVYVASGENIPDPVGSPVNCTLPTSFLMSTGAPRCETTFADGATSVLQLI